MRNGFIVLGLGLTALAPQGAQGADLPTRKTPVPILAQAPAPDWSGLYAGTIVGVGLGVYTTRETASASASAPGLLTGALIGYNWQYGAIVYGLESDLSANYAKGKIAAAPGLVANNVDNIYALHGRARLGYDLGVFMPFIAGGLVYGRNEQYQQAPLDFDGDTHGRLGWTLGAGVDVKVNLPLLGPSVLRAEYLYDSYPTTGFDLNGPALRTGIADHTVRVALITRIDEAWRPPANPDTIDWSGDYAGVIGGGAWDSLSTKGLGATTKFSASGPIGGIYTGHNWMFGDAMLGLEGATTLANIAGHGAQPGATATDYRNFTESDARARAGYALGRFMPFVAAGLSYGQSRQVDQITGADQGLISAVSWTAGVGADYMLSERLALRAEYLYSRSLNNEETHLDSDACCSQRRSTDTLRIGLAYYFH